MPLHPLRDTPDKNYRTITIHDFAKIFGVSVFEIPEKCLNVVKKSDFRYTEIRGKERDNVLLRVLKTLNTPTVKVAGAHRKDDWEKGWAENLENFRASQSDIQELIPKFVKKKEAIRFHDDYIMPADDEFETNFVTFLRYYLFGKYFAGVSKVFEFGCGTGLNLVAVSELFPRMELVGLDWAEASCEIVDELAKKLQLNLRSSLFDMFSPDNSVKVDSNSVVFTIGAMEQIGTNFQLFLDFLLKKKPALCLNIEPLYELNDSNLLFDYLAMFYIEKRNYLRGYLEQLRKLEKQGVIKILDTRNTFGGLYHNAYSYVVWRPEM